MSDRDILLTMAWVAGPILLVVGGGIGFFAYLARRERAKRERDIRIASDLRP